jgi:hypothetical protein
VRILVTGSRNWMNRVAIQSQIVAYVTECGLRGLWGDVTIVHGACPTGADMWADDFAVTNFCNVERHPADWKKNGKIAGPIRNIEMVELGADVCLAFINECSRRHCDVPKAHGSHGATHCAVKALAAGIETRIFGILPAGYNPETRQLHLPH